MSAASVQQSTSELAGRTPSSVWPSDWSLADLQHHLGGIPAERIRLVPAPGYATVGDLVAIADREDRLYELEDGVLVEKPMGWQEAILATLISAEIVAYLKTHDLGQVLGADGPLEILPGKIKLPDVAYIGWHRFPKQRLGRRPVPALVPDLAVEVLSETNTRAEMDRKLQQYFEAGVSLVWYIGPQSRSARVFTSPSDVTEFDELGLLNGGQVLPGFQLSLQSLFKRADRQGPPPGE
jgi:Uma2 family endonuclease